jgi:F/Y-rich N-terminus
MNEQMDPDNDGFNINLDDAERLNKYMNILHFIRKYILANNSKLFYNGLTSLTESSIANNPNGYLLSNYMPYPYTLPDGWDCNIHDKGLLNAVADNGINFLHNISNNQNYNFSKMKLCYEDALNRVNYLCEFFRDFTSGNKNKKKNYLYFNNLQENPLPTPNVIPNPNISNVSNFSSSVINNNLSNNNGGNKNIDYRRKSNKLSVNRDEYGKIQYPIIINSSLQILNLGEIIHEKPSFHSEKNLFPVGFKSIREHSSMFKLGERTQYTCEILDGGNKPLYKLTSNEDPENPIIKESSTGCWVKLILNILNLDCGL